MAESYKTAKLTKEEKAIYKNLTPEAKKQFIKLSPTKRRQIVKKALKRTGKVMGLPGYVLSSDSISALAEAVDAKEGAGKLAQAKFAKHAGKAVMTSAVFTVKAPYNAKKAYTNYKYQEKMYDSTGKRIRGNRKVKKDAVVSQSDIHRLEGTTRKGKPLKKKGKSGKKSKSSRAIKHISKQVERSVLASGNGKAQNIQKQKQAYAENVMQRGLEFAGRKALRAVGSVMAKVMSLLVSVVSTLVTALAPVLLVIAVIAAVVAAIVSIFGIVEEEEQEMEVGTSLLSPAVEALREDISKELKKYGKEAYINLYLAVVEHETHGEGSDVFQCSESLGMPAGTLTKEASIRQGVKYLSGMIDRAGVKGIDDMENIRTALQGYNYNGSYITWVEKIGDGKWTQENALKYQQIASHGVQNMGNRVKTLGPYKYGDAYYTDHVLQYYSNVAGTENIKAGEAAKVSYENKQQYLWNGVSPPTTPTAMRNYLTAITVPIYNEFGIKTTMNLTVHKKLAEEFKAAFEDMAEEKFPIKASQTAAYVWKEIAGSSTRSQHSYGAAIDINWGDNPCFYNTNVDVTNGYGGYQPGKNKYSVTQMIVKIWNVHGFYWGGDWIGKKDTMHFSYTEKPGG